MSLDAVEIRRPPRNALVARAGLLGRLIGRVQWLADLQVFTASRDAQAWLRQRRGPLLEVGCGEQPYRRFVPAACRYTGIDRAEAGADFRMSPLSDITYYSGATFPVASASMDALFHTEVMEHVLETGAFLDECARVLRPGGAMFFTVPFQARYHFKPHDYFRFTPAALAHLLATHGFEAVTVSPRGNDIAVAGYKVAAIPFRWAYEGLLGKLLFAAAIPLTATALLVAHAAMAFRLGSDDDCLGYSVTARRAEPAGASSLTPR
ncbi:class I SAM-dependent methyltransferase [Methylobacterium sp. J-068]|uniref:class I SAM-dependent methyltransferase n=1 Tax=Methylobacterium sp. J-068 TaxID=2836649 RepID=UPI001FBBF200|nr:class I SAM-dependent methyltransferase [Methylobacterium sp. J-068]MCJ2033147.1 class I SAM-dependent methyltransferase [Methylobacterium sp. J-068]